MLTGFWRWQTGKLWFDKDLYAEILLNNVSLCVCVYVWHTLAPATTAAMRSCLLVEFIAKFIWSRSQSTTIRHAEVCTSNVCVCMYGVCYLFVKFNHQSVITKCCGLSKYNISDTDVACLLSWGRVSYVCVYSMQWDTSLCDKVVTDAIPSDGLWLLIKLSSSKLQVVLNFSIRAITRRRRKIRKFTRKFDRYIL